MLGDIAGGSLGTKTGGSVFTVTGGSLGAAAGGSVGAAAGGGSTGLVGGGMRQVSVGNSGAVHMQTRIMAISKLTSAILIVFCTAPTNYKKTRRRLINDK